MSAACCQVSSRFRARMEAFNREDGHQNKRKMRGKTAVESEENWK